MSPICLSPCFRLLRLYTGEQNSGSLEEIDALLGMGNGPFIASVWLTFSCPRSAVVGRIVQLMKEAEMFCCPQSGREAGETIALSGDGVADKAYSR